MKSRLFYVLYILYVIMVAFIMYINGIFRGEMPSLSNLLINGIFLLLIGIIFIISGIGFARLARCTDELQDATTQLLDNYRQAGEKNLWQVYQNKKDVFTEPELKKAFGKYRMRIKSGQQKKGYVEDCSIDEYLNEDLLHSVGLNYFNSAVSTTLTGLGILGTFLGLSWGLSSFSGDDIYTISDNVGPLLTGMKVAFHTSVYGIFFSLVFQFIYRSIMTDAYDKLENFLDAFRQCAMPVRASEDANQASMLIYQANMAASLKKLLELEQGNADRQQEGLMKLVDRYLVELDRQMGTGMHQLGNALQNTVQNQMEYVTAGKQLADVVSRLVSETAKMQENLFKIQERQEEFARELEKQKQELSQTCEEISSDISNQLYTFEQMRNLYEK